MNIAAPGTPEYRRENIRAALSDLKTFVEAGDSLESRATLATVARLVEEYMSMTTENAELRRVADAAANYRRTGLGRSDLFAALDDLERGS